MSRLCKDLTPANPEALLLAAMPELIDIPPKAYEAIHQVHSETAGHHGVDRTVEKLLQWCKDHSVEPWPLYVGFHVVNKKS